MIGRLSQNFHLSEFLVSQTAARMGIDMSAPASVISNLAALCDNVLEPLRAHYEKPVIISSGYRPAALNRAIGGSSNSQHCKGQAADFRVLGVSNIKVCRWLEANRNYDQLIYEFGEAGWVHVSWRANYRNMELSAVKRRVWGRLKTVYLPGIVA